MTGLSSLSSKGSYVRTYIRRNDHFHSAFTTCSMFVLLYLFGIADFHSKVIHIIFLFVTRQLQREFVRENLMTEVFLDFELIFYIICCANSSCNFPFYLSTIFGTGMLNTTCSFNAFSTEKSEYSDLT